MAPPAAPLTSRPPPRHSLTEEAARPRRRPFLPVVIRRLRHLTSPPSIHHRRHTLSPPAMEPSTEDPEPETLTQPPPCLNPREE
uniref:Uncharacterized protein n=1 Tax=Setaria viridis TaxID=4556 RepID=A0A4U6UFV4_SETVI|nr:hypothetical protein SEVIR_6G087000v2 [Setaria viridis]